ncbi:hypothetical protein [Algicella marina]|uniref:Sulfotransferase domain-containing protein n=1 Tax=Algicella marina TaxID=2683284 RepID=A0A6P1T011_9RHOB|nr:hypothetical protein [Algicella marina]QHQ34963.1 hypothetical protein GO499_07010 [Algicella marina]
MTKCGSTLAFQITHTALMEAGCPQPAIPFPGESGRRVNFIPQMSEGRESAIRAALSETGNPIVIKTHGRPTPRMVNWIESGEGRGHAIFRDPRDMALSMLDHGRTARERNRPAFAEIHTLEDACKGIANQLDSLTAWLQLPGIAALQYDTLAFQTETAAQHILEQLGLGGNPRRIARRVLRSGKTLMNKGIASRYKTEMSPEISAAFLSRFRPFYDILLDKPDVALPLRPNTILYDPEALAKPLPAAA